MVILVEALFVCLFVCTCAPARDKEAVAIRMEQFLNLIIISILILKLRQYIIFITEHCYQFCRCSGDLVCSYFKMSQYVREHDICSHVTFLTEIRLPFLCP